MLRILFALLASASLAAAQIHPTAPKAGAAGTPATASIKSVETPSGVSLATLANPGFRKVLATGHRGAPLHAPENTLASLEAAVAMGADIIEIDVRYTRDGRWVIFHDSTVGRITGENGAIEQRTLEEVQALRINLPHFPKHRDLRILTLEEALGLLKGRALAYLDHKTGPALLLARELQRQGATDRAYIVARTPQWARELRRAGADIHIMGAINDDEPDSLLPHFLAARLTLMELPLKHLTPANVALLRRNGVRVFTNSLGPEEKERFDAFQKLLYRGADVIQTDHLDWLVPYLRSFNSVEPRSYERHPAGVRR